MISSPIINNNNTTAISLQNNTTPKNNNTTTTMTPQDDVFTQLYQALTPSTSTMGTPFISQATEPSSVFDEWLKQDFFSSESVNSSPEIATPLDQFLMSPPFDAKDDMTPACQFASGADLDVSAILDSPVPPQQLFNAPMAAPTPAVATVATATPIVAATATATPVLGSATTSGMVTPMTNLFADIGESLPAALAALAAVAAPAPIVKTPTCSTVEMSPAVASASTPTFSTKQQTTKKRSSASVTIDEDGEPIDDAAVKRQKNTDAARRSRLRKVQKMETLETRVSELEKINAGLLMRVAVLDSEKTNLKAKESSYESRIKVLEEQLAEAHKALSSRS